MTAKEMFEKLGYKQQEVINKENYLLYISKMNEIIFNKKHKQVGKQIVNSAITDMITLEELQAINKQVEELGWNND